VASSCFARKGCAGRAPDRPLRGHRRTCNLGRIASPVRSNLVFGSDTRDATLKTFGRVDILVNNAGIGGPTQATWEYPFDAWRRIMAVNFDGAFYCCRALIPGMIANNYGRIINIASVAGKEGNPNMAAYSASKAAMISLTKSLGKELATYDISVNCITPSSCKTELLKDFDEEFVRTMLAKVPRGRFVLVEEIAAMVEFCSSTECSFTTGGVFDISGGRATY
jgi:3-oxoacyl-[acyl-carrier protein] reductase